MLEIVNLFDLQSQQVFLGVVLGIDRSVEFAPLAALAVHRGSLLLSDLVEGQLPVASHPQRPEVNLLTDLVLRIFDVHHPPILID
jgi:hypothetical protein